MLNISKLCAGLSTSRLEGGDGPDLTFWTRSWASLWSVVSSQSLGIQRQGLREFSEDLPQAYAEQESRGTAWEDSHPGPLWSPSQWERGKRWGPRKGELCPGNPELWGSLDSSSQALFFFILPSPRQPLCPFHQSEIDCGFPGTGPLAGGGWPTSLETQGTVGWVWSWTLDPQGLGFRTTSCLCGADSPGWLAGYSSDSRYLWPAGIHLLQNGHILQLPSGILVEPPVPARSHPSVLFPLLSSRYKWPSYRRQCQDSSHSDGAIAHMQWTAHSYSEINALKLRLCNCPKKVMLM